MRNRNAAFVLFHTANIDRDQASFPISMFVILAWSTGMFAALAVDSGQRLLRVPSIDI